MDCAFDQRNSHKTAPLLAVVCWVCISVELKRRMSSTSDHSDLSSFSVHSDDDDSSLEREECRSQKRRRLVAPVTGCVLLQRKKRVKIPSARCGMKKRTRRDPDVLLQESADDGMFHREHRMSCPSFCTLF
jgi:hypothetical protein